MDRHGFVRVRDAAQLQRAHDILFSLAEETPEPKDPLLNQILYERPTRTLPTGISQTGIDLMFQILVAADVLCWVLEDAKQSEFGDLLDTLETLLTSCGYEINVFHQSGSRPQ